MKPISYISYINEFIALILFILTLLEVIPNEVVMFYILWVMGLFMSAFAGNRDLGGPQEVFTVFTPIIAILLCGLGVFQLGILIASFFPQIGNYTLLLIILFISIGAKWGLVHGYKLYSRKK